MAQNHNFYQKIVLGAPLRQFYKQLFYFNICEKICILVNVVTFWERKKNSSSDLVGWVAKKGLEIVGKSFTKDIGWERWVIMDDQLRRGLQRQGWGSTWNQKKKKNAHFRWSWCSNDDDDDSEWVKKQKKIPLFVGKYNGLFFLLSIPGWG